MTLRRPPGKTAYALELAGHEGLEIYVILQLGAHDVIGHSFYKIETRGCDA
jgi:hypothetical protein